MEQIHYEIVPATSVSAPCLNAFYEMMFPERAEFLKQHWRWLYRVAEYDWAPSPAVAVAEGKVIGHAGIIPVILRHQGEERRAMWLVDLAILPELQRQGLGMALTRALMAQCPIQLGFCNERSLGALLKCGWEVRFGTRSLQLLLHPERHPKLQNSSWAKVAGVGTRGAWRARTLFQKEISVEPASPENLAEFARHDFGRALHVVRSDSFLNWRISKHPQSGQHVILRGQTGGESQCKAIARISGEERFRKLHLLSLAAPSDKNALSGFLAGVIRWAAREDFDRVLMVTSDPSVTAVAKWWLPISTALRFIYYANDASARRLLASAEQYWECIDNDFDLT
jgi:GNAT superfamily N-acetyltransferase